MHSYRLIRKCYTGDCEEDCEVSDEDSEEDDDDDDDEDGHPHMQAPTKKVSIVTEYVSWTWLVFA